MWEFIDVVYGISLRERGAERRPKTEESLGEAGFADRLRWLLREPDSDGGEAGCFRSHVAAAKTMLKSGAEWGLVFEDDARYFGKNDVPNLEEVERDIARFCAAVPQSEPCWIQLGYMGWFLTRKPKRVHDHVVRVESTSCMHAYLINRQMMLRLSALEWLGVPIDFVTVSMSPHYVATPMLFYQADEGSHVANNGNYAVLNIQRTFTMRKLSKLSEYYVANYDACITSIALLLALFAAAFAVSLWATITKAGPDSTGVTSGVFSAICGVLLVLGFAAICCVTKLQH